MASSFSNREGQITKSTGDRLSSCGVPMVVANVDPMPCFSLGCSVVSASSIGK